MKKNNRINLNIETDYKDINWAVNFEITLNGKTVKFEDLSESAKDFILEQIKEDYYSGTFVD